MMDVCLSNYFDEEKKNIDSISVDNYFIYYMYDKLTFIRRSRHFVKALDYKALVK